MKWRTFVVCALSLGATHRAEAASRPVASDRQPAGAIDVLVPVDASARSAPVADWTAQLKSGGAKVTSVQPLASMHPAARLEVALAFDISASFKGHLPTAVALAKRFVEKSRSTGLDVRVTVHTFGITNLRLGDETTLDKVQSQPSQQRTQLRKLVGEIVVETANAVRFPDGLREVVLFTDGGEESAAFQDYAQITEPALAGAVVVDAVLFQANTPSTLAATLADKLGSAVEQTGGAMVRVDPARPAEPQMRSRLDDVAAAPSSFVRVHVETCGLTAPGEHADRLSFSVGQPPWRSMELPIKLQVPAGGGAACAPAPASSQATPIESKTKSAPWWPWALIALVAAIGIGVAVALTRRSSAPAPIAPVPPPPVVPEVGHASARPPLVVPSPTPWLEKHGANPLARTLATELHVEASAIPLGSPLRIARPEVRVGRDPEMELALDHASVSNHHATLLVEPNGELFVIDHGSTNGTYVGQERVTANQKHHVPRGSALSFSQHIRLRVVQPWRAKVQGRTT